MIIFHIIYPFIVLYYSFTLSQSIDFRCIFVGLIFTIIQIISLFLNIIFLQNYRLLHFGLTSIIFSLLAFILFSVLWIKDSLSLIINSLFWIYTNAYYLFWIFISSKLCTIDGYFYSALIFNYSIFLGFAYYIAVIIKYITNIIINSYEHKSFLIKNFIILFIQHLIILFGFLGISFNFQKGFSNPIMNIFSIIIQIFIFLFLICFYCSNKLYNSKKGFYMIILFILYPLIVLHYISLLSQSIDYRCIIIGLIFILIEILSLFLNTIYLKDFQILYFGLISIIFSFIGLFLFSFLWMKDSLSIVIISLFWLYTNGYYALWIFFCSKLYELDEYFYSVLIFNYGLLLGLAYWISNIIKNLINVFLKNSLDDRKKFFAKNFIILFFQYFIIVLFSLLGFSFNVNELFWNLYMHIFSIILQIFIIIFFIIFFAKNDLYNNKNGRYMIIFHIIYPLIVLYYSFILSQSIDYRCIIVGLVFSFIQIITLFFNIFYLNNFRLLYAGLTSIIFSLLAFVLFSVLWIKESLSIIIISFFLIYTNAYYICWIIISLKVCKDDEHFYSAIIFNYSIFLGVDYGLITGFKSIIKSGKDNIYQSFFSNEKTFLFKNFIILLFQHIIIILFSFLWFFIDFHKTPINDVIHIFSIIIQSIVIIAFIIFLFSGAKIYEKNTGRYLIIFHIIYSFIIVYFCLLLSQAMDYKYVIIGLSFNMIIILSVILNIIYLKHFQLLYFFISSVIFSLIGLILFSGLWIKDLLPIIYVSLFWIFINGYYILWIFIILRLYQEEYNYFFTLLVFNYYLFLGLAFVLKYVIIGIGITIQYIAIGIQIIIKKISRRYYSDNFSKFEFKIFFILLVQYTIITICVWIGFSLDIEVNLSAFVWTLVITTLFNIILCVIFVCSLFGVKNCECNNFCSYHFFYVPIMIFYYFIFSFCIEEKYILCFLFMVFFNLLFIATFIFFWGYKQFYSLFIICVVSDTITLLSFHFLWLKSERATINYIIIFACIAIYITAISWTTIGNEKFEETLIINILNYGLFILAFFIAAVAIALGLIVAVIGIFIAGCIIIIIGYLLYLCVKCICEEI